MRWSGAAGRRYTRALVGSTVALVALACSAPATGASPASTASGTSTSLPTTARPTPGGCGRTQVYQGPAPAWVEEASAHSLRAGGPPYAIAVPAIAAGFIFGYPLRAGHPRNPSSKVLWVVRSPRQGSPLQVDGHPLGAQQPAVHESVPADSGPGEIYPDGADVPSAGCWQFTLRWATGTAGVDLEYL